MTCPVPWPPSSVIIAEVNAWACASFCLDGSASSSRKASSRRCSGHWCDGIFDGSGGLTGLTPCGRIPCSGAVGADGPFSIASGVALRGVVVFPVDRFSASGEAINVCLPSPEFLENAPSRRTRCGKICRFVSLPGRSTMCWPVPSASL